VVVATGAFHHPTWLSGPHPGNEPFRAGGRADRLTIPLLWFALSRVLSVDNPVGRRLRPKLLTAAAPLARVRRDLDAAGIGRVPRTTGVRGGLPLLEDGRALEVANVVWCTGFRHDFSWIDLPVFDAGDEPRQDRGVVGSQPGLYFVGLHFLTSIVSPLVGGSATTPGTSRPGSPEPSPLRWQRAHERRARCTRSNRCCWR
jgi:putative flavoprotein involved in K+ transport